MAITQYEKDGTALWKVYVNLRSKVDPSVRVQKHLLDFKSEAAARSEEKRLIKLLTEKLLQEEGRGSHWEYLIERWEETMKQDQFCRISPLSIGDYAGMMKLWTKNWLKKPASEITKADVRDVVKEMDVQGTSSNYQRKMKNAINLVFTWAIEERIIRGVQESPAYGVQVKERKEDKPPEIFNLDQIRKLLYEAKRLEHPWYPVWATALLTGMRSGELHALLWTDVDIETRRLTVSRSFNNRANIVKTTKGAYWRNVPISGELHQLLLELKASAGKREQVLPRFWEWDHGDQARVLRTFCVGVGLPSVRFHTLRACFATQLLAHSIAPARVMKICGWKDLKTMERYVRLAGIDENGATECLQVLSSDAEVMDKVVHLFDPRAGSR